MAELAVPVRFHKPHLIIVEGRDEVGFLICLLEQLQIETVQIHQIQGVSTLAKKLGVVTKTAGFSDVKRLCILLDSDLDPAGRQQSIRDALKSLGLPVPDGPEVLSGGEFQVMYSTVPAHNTEGCLEDLLMQSLAGMPHAQCVNNFLGCAGMQAMPLTSRWSKAWVHSFLSLADVAGLKIGEATNAGTFDLSHVSFNPMRQLITSFAAQP
ncbi:MULTISPECIES: DUF3226 domain-containing protein [Polaromonas]|uniref:DUF3226 domain-containing protein n=1 Tax=Polaromonas aquatica TaxID=332657 RepID=A0ABW1TRQ1_9BURK